MSNPRSDPTRGLPGWLVLVGSVAVAGHLLAIGTQALAARSGPWPFPNGGSDFVFGPQFAQAVTEKTTPKYLYPLKLTHNYHFDTNQPDLSAVYYEVFLKDASGQPLKDETGKPMKPIRIPDEKANFWVWHREWLLARALTDDRPVAVEGGEKIAAPKKNPTKLKVWRSDTPGGVQRIVEVEEYLLPRNEPIFRPSTRSLILARACVRHLCREHGAAKAELIRHYRQPVLAGFMFVPQPPPDLFKEIVCNFGDEVNP
jgi:hypothetical protein